MAERPDNWVVLIANKHLGDSSSAADPAAEARQLVARARSIAPPDRICGLIAARSPGDWGALSAHLLPQNTFIHPEGEPVLRGIVRCLEAVSERTLRANVILLPADHCAVDEAAWLASVQGALSPGRSTVDTVYLLHDKPENDPRVSLAYPGICSSSVMIGSIGSLLSFCRGSRATLMVDLMVDDAGSPPTDAVPDAEPIPDAEPPLQVVHVRSVEEYARLQRGDYGRRAANRIDTHA